jgi:hypothetical protein
VRVVSTVKSRTNHYELLGLTPSAAGDAIAEAFARATSVFRPHAFGSITELCVAYETLRDPARRRAYDASLGLNPIRNIAPVRRPASAHFMQWPAGAASPSAPVPDPVPQPAPRIERAPQPPAAAPHTPFVEPEPQPAPWTERAPEPRPAPRIASAPEPIVAPLPLRPAYDEVSVGVRPIEWRRTGAVVGGLAAAAVFVGAFAGWWSGNSASEPVLAAAPSAAPPEQASPTFSELWQEPAPRAVATRATQPRAVRTRPRAEFANRRAHAAPTEAERELIQPPPDLADPATADPLAPETAPAPVIAATMPLPHRTVARTIDRIGYACGSVASATPVEGARGAYKVTCTSGQSFQAKPVNGRYRFRRVARN